MLKLRKYDQSGNLMAESDPLRREHFCDGDDCGKKMDSFGLVLVNDEVKEFCFACGVARKFNREAKRRALAENVTVAISKSGKPSAIRVREKKVPVKSWKMALMEIVRLMIEDSSAADQLCRQFPKLVRTGIVSDFRIPETIGSVTIETHFAAAAIQKNVAKMAAHIGLRGEDVEFVVGQK